MKCIRINKSILFIIFCLIFFLTAHPAIAQQASPVPQKAAFMKARVIGFEGEKKNPYSDYKQVFHIVDVIILEGPSVGKIVQVEYDSKQIDDLMVHTGDTVILSKTSDASGKPIYIVESKYRLVSVVSIAIGFALLVILIAGWRGIGSFIGLGISIASIFLYIVPQILAGQDPLTICMIGAIGILFLTTYAAHGVSKRTTIALFSTLLALFITFLLSIIFVKFSLLTGYADENSLAIHFGTGHVINVKGLLLGGIIIGTLGALNDVTTTQTATIFELAKIDKTLTYKQLFRKGLFIGREHLISLINTLVLAYAGSSLTVFIFLFYNSTYYPLWVILNSEVLNEEVIRTIAGTAGLILVVPIVTLLSSIYCDEKTRQEIKNRYKFIH